MDSDYMNELERSEFGRFYTKPDIGGALVELMRLRQPKRVVDLGAGGGSLALAAARRWSNLDLLTIDVDASSDRRVTALLSTEDVRSHRHLLQDALEPDLAGLVQAKFGKFDAAICNPPFTTPVWRTGFERILEESGFSGCMPVLADSDSALLFLSQALRIIGEGSTLGIILPDGLISGSKYRKFREELLRRYRVDAVVRLPPRSFMHTEARAHILIVRKGCGGSKIVPLQKLVEGRLLAASTTIDIEQAAICMDYDFHAQGSVARVGPTFEQRARPLGELALEIHRGSVQATVSRQLGLQVLHTTDIVEAMAGKWVRLQSGDRLKGDRRHWAEPGDILIARVGRNLENKVLGVRSGTALLTDCLYRVKIPKNLAEIALKQLCSEFGRTWLASRSSGVGAKHLTLANLLAFPIMLEK